MRTLLIDADISIFKICAAAQEEFHWDGEHTTLYSNLKECQASLDAQMRAYQEILEADQIVLALSDKANFRKAVYPEYKANRKESVKPMNMNSLRAYVQDTYNCKQLPTLEADDVIGILATGDWIKGEKIIVSIDKDMKQIPGKLARPNRNEMENLEISKDEAALYFYSQVLIGDTTDNYPGCPKIGEVTAAKHLNNLMTEEEMWEKVVELYEKAGLTEYDALIQARCARILQSSDFIMSEKLVVLWKPNNLKEETLAKLGAA